MNEREIIMFHKKALKNTITCFVLLTLVFSTLIVVAFAASENLSSKYLTGTITADKSFWGDSASAGGEYIENPIHMEVQSCLYAWAVIWELVWMHILMIGRCRIFM